MLTRSSSAYSTEGNRYRRMHIFHVNKQYFQLFIRFVGLRANVGLLANVTRGSRASCFDGNSPTVLAQAARTHCTETHAPKLICSALLFIQLEYSRTRVAGSMPQCTLSRHFGGQVSCWCHDAARLMRFATVETFTRVA